MKPERESEPETVSVSWSSEVAGETPGVAEAGDGAGTADPEEQPQTNRSTAVKQYNHLFICPTSYNIIVARGGGTPICKTEKGGSIFAASVFKASASEKKERLAIVLKDGNLRLL